MISRTLGCDRDRLRLLLDDQLAEARQAEVARHVEACADCQRELEDLAADRNWWRQTREFLSGEPLGEAEEAPRLDFLSPSDNPAMLGRVGGHEVLEIIGRGGMGVVLKAYDGELNRYVAIKVLAPQFATSAAARRRFAREAQAAAAVVHQHVIAIHEVGTAQNLPYLVMPLVAGETLQQRLNDDGPFDLKDLLRVGMQVAEGLSAAHAQGLVHRDIKPANILLERNVERVLITDFGLARAVDDASLTRTGTIAGTPQYMSPEQARGEPVDHRSDLFSLGSVLYAMATGRPPFRAETALAVLRRICEETPRPVQEESPDLPRWLDWIINKLHAREPANRFASAREVGELLQQCLAHVQQPLAVPLPTLLRPDPAASWRRWLLRLAPALLAGVLLVFLMIYGFHPDPKVADSPTATPLSPTQRHGPEPQLPPGMEWDDEWPRELRGIERGLERLENSSRF